MRNKDGVVVPPGQYQVRLKVGDKTFTEHFNVLIDPRVAADGVTVADLQEQYEHNMRMRALVNDVNRLVARVREAQRNSNATAGNGESTARLNALAAKLLTEPVRYGKPGLQAHITYLAGMTANVDQKIGRDAIERYAVLKKEFDAVKAEADQVVGTGVKSRMTFSVALWFSVSRWWIVSEEFHHRDTEVAQRHGARVAKLDNRSQRYRLALQPFSRSGG